MEKMMILQECSALNERTIPTNEGTKVVESFEVVFTDMIDTVMGETGRTLTVQFKQEPPVVGKIYNVSARLDVVNYEKDGRKGRFFKCNILKAKPM